MSNIKSLDEYKLELQKRYRSVTVPNTDPEFVTFLMNTLDELEMRNSNPYDTPPEPKAYITFLVPIVLLINIISVLIGFAILQWMGY